MAFVPKSSDGVTTGTTAVTLVAAPASSTYRMVRTITVYNRDTAARTVTLQFVSAGGTRVLVEQDLQPGETLIWDDVVTLDATTKSITAVLDAAPATNQLDWTSTYADLT